MSSASHDAPDHGADDRTRGHVAEPEEADGHTDGHTPTHGSWLTQVELGLGVVSRRVLRHGNSRSPDELVRALEEFIVTWNLHEGHAPASGLEYADARAESGVQASTRTG